MKNKILKLIIFGFFSITIVYAESGSFKFKPITINGDMSEITLTYIRRQNYFNQFGNNIVYPDGIALYFVIFCHEEYRSKEPVIEMLNNFRINNVGYREINRENGIINRDPVFILYDEKTIQEHDEFYDKVNIQHGKEAIILKIIVLGTNIPDNASVNYDLKYGYDNQTEEFNFQFFIDDIEK